MALTESNPEVKPTPQNTDFALLAPIFVIDDPLGLGLPFALWTVGDQPILDHWLDFALMRVMNP